MPLRSERQPDGLDGLQGLDLTRVRAANRLYALTGGVIEAACRNGQLVVCENPGRSHFWGTSFMQLDVPFPLNSAHLHHCMVGSDRKKFTRLMANFPQIGRVQLLCDGQHIHRDWAPTAPGKFATAEETACPPEMCRLLAATFHDAVLSAGALPSAESLAHMQVSLARASQVVTGKQPKGKRLMPMVSEHASYVHVTGPASLLPQFVGRCELPVCLRSQVVSEPSTKCLPAHARCVSSSL